MRGRCQMLHDGLRAGFESTSISTRPESERQGRPAYPPELNWRLTQGPGAFANDLHLMLPKNAGPAWIHDQNAALFPWKSCENVLLVSKQTNQTEAFVSSPSEEKRPVREH